MIRLYATRAAIFLIMSLEKVFDTNALLRGWYAVNEVSGWKESTQRFEM